jgi:hypothetical protein
MSERDPIFALIEKQRRLEAEWEELAKSDGAPFALTTQVAPPMKVFASLSARHPARWRECGQFSLT